MESLTSFLGEHLEIRGASLWILVGGLLALLAGGVSVWGAIKNNQEVEDMVLGRRHTFCQLTIYGNNAIGWYISTFHNGSGNIYDVQTLIREVREDGTPITDRSRLSIGTLTSNTWPWNLFVLQINAPQRNLVPRYFEAQITQRNGTSLQDIVIYPQPDGGIAFGFVRLEFNTKIYPPNFSYLQPGQARGIDVPQQHLQRILALRHQRGPQP